LNGAETWTAELDINPSVSPFTYFYFVRRADGSLRLEWGKPHSFLTSLPLDSALIIDHWQDSPVDKPYYATSFVDCINRRDRRDDPVFPVPGMLTISVDAPMVPTDCVVAMAGSVEYLGSWDTDKALRLSDASFPRWTANIPISELSSGLEYKFIIVKKSSGELVAWEGRDNRYMHPLHPDLSSVAVINSGQRFVSSGAPWRGAGVAIPVFSLRSDDDFGVGDFFDLKEMIDWAAKTRQRFVQLLPVNDTTMTGSWTDSYPYNANSTFALHPMYLRLQAMGSLADPERRRHYDELRRELNRLPEVDYEKVNQAKNAFTRELFDQDGPAALASPDFVAFVDKNSSWLTPYAAWCVLRDLNNTPDMTLWGDYAVYDEARVADLVTRHRRSIEYVYWIQYHLDRQMREVHEYARMRGVAIKGDIPIGISRHSVDAWISPRLFNLDCQAGAPPDDFSVLGQNWGFPTYNWEEMSSDGFAWWKARFRKMAEYFDAYRIDHVLGFFRIWQIPMNAIHGLLGIFNRALPFSTDELRSGYDFWLDTERQTLPYIHDWMLHDIFGEWTDEVSAQFLLPRGDGSYRLRPEFDTQRKVAAHFSSLPNDEKNSGICNGLLALIDDVLFIEDPVEKGKYHPRISAHSSYSYRALGDYEKWCFNRLYNDFFYHRNNDFWYQQAMWKMPPLIEATDMLTCAEDLGMIPACVPAVMDQLRILVLEIQRMPKDPATPFGNTWAYPYRSVCTTSSHDMDGIRRWWETDRDITQRFFNEVLREPGEAPQQALPDICERIINLHLKSPSMLCILPLQDWLSIDGVVRRQDPAEELINIPANPRHYWRYRMHITLAELNGLTELNNRIRSLIHSSGR
ncbi:MAG: 4-alpha-glucanotransferase, partial [Duncaniella sp.]|nr:4-alpha-glucanotransferase [Duncaniella sp.]